MLMSTTLTTLIYSTLGNWAHTSEPTKALFGMSTLHLTLHSYCGLLLLHITPVLGRIYATRPDSKTRHEQPPRGSNAAIGVDKYNNQSSSFLRTSTHECISERRHQYNLQVSSNPTRQPSMRRKYTSWRKVTQIRSSRPFDPQHRIRVKNGTASDGRTSP